MRCRILRYGSTRRDLSRCRHGRPSRVRSSSSATCSPRTARSTPAPRTPSCRQAARGRRGAGRRPRTAPPARRRLPRRGRRRPAALGTGGLRRPRLPRLAAAVPAAAAPRRRPGAPRAVPDVHPERQHRPAARGRAAARGVAGLGRRARGHVHQRAVRAGLVPRLHRRLRHPQRRAVPRDGRRARGAQVRLGRDLLRPRGGPLPHGHLGRRRDDRARAARRTPPRCSPTRRSRRRRS